MAINLFIPTFQIDECLAEIKQCLEKGWTGLGFKTIEFEDAWKAYTGLSNAHFLSSNTVGLHLAFDIFKKKYGWQDEDEIITTPLTFIATNHAIKYCKLKPVFADIDETMCLDPKDVVKKITPKTKAIIFVGIGGNIGRYFEIVRLCKKQGLKLILDAAHMAGTRYNEEHVGKEADVTVFSFQAVKNLPTADSGMVCFTDPEDDARARKLSWLGINKDTYSRTVSQGSYKWMYDVEDVGFKYHGNSIMAAIGLVQLRHLDQDNAYRRQIATWYRQELSGVKNIKMIPITDGCESSTHLFQIRTNKRNELMLALHENEIYPGVHYRDNTEYSMYAYANGTCPNAHKISKEILSLPIHLKLSHDDIRCICAIIKECLSV